MNTRNIRFLIVATALCGCFSVLLAKPPCELSEADYAALAHNAKKQPLDRAAIDALNEKDAENVCKARAFVAKIHTLAGANVTKISDEQAEKIAAKINLHEIATGTSRFVTEDEWDFIAPVIGYVMANASTGKFR
jgi:hypothetical protein